MTTEIRTLRVSAEMDASKYAAGAAQKVAADKGMAAAGKEAAAAFTQQDQKISQARDVLARLSRQYVDGYASAQRFNSAINALSRGVELGKIEMTQASAILDGIYKKYGLMADASQLAQRGQLDLARAVEQANARLAAQQKITPANQNSVLGRGQVGSFNTANIAAQFQDIAVTSAMGMAPMQIALQQGTQLSMVFEQMKASGQSAGTALAAAFTSILSPMSLVTIGLVAGSAALIQYFSSAESESEKTNKLLKEQNDVIRSAAKAWGDATPSLKAYVEQLDQVDKITQGREASDILAGRSLEKIGVGLEGLRDKAVSAFSALQARGVSTDEIRVLGYAWDGLKERVAAGTATVADFNAAKTALADTLQKYALPALSDFAKGVDGVTSAFYSSLEAAQRAREEWIKAIAGGTNVQDIISGATFTEDGRIYQAGSFVPRNPGVPTRRPLNELDGDPASPTVTNSDGRTVAVPVPEQKPIQLGFDADKIDKAAEAYRDLIKSANDRVAQMRLEAEVSGQTGIAAQALRFELDLLQKAQEKGRTVTEEQRQQIKGLAEDYRAAAEAAAKAKLQQDLMFERAQLFRSASDQAIAARLRGSGLPVDFQSPEAQMIRDNLRIAETREAIGSFFSDFNAELLKGGSDLGKRLGDVLANALMNQVSKLTSRIFENLTNALTDAIFGNGGSRLGGIAPAFKANTTLGEFLGMRPANDNAPSGDMRLFREAISAIESGGNYSALGPITRSGDRAYGRYQVMGNNIGPWSQEALGRTLTPSQFLADPAAQNAVFDHRFGSYVSRYGATGAAKAWFGGPGAVNGNGNAMDALGTSVSQYADKFNNAVGSMSTSVTSATGSIGSLGSGLNAATQGLGQLGNGLGQFGNNLANMFPSAPGGGVSGGGLGTWLGNLWGNLTNGPGTQWATAVSGGFTPGLFADGTPFAPGGMAIVGERGRELVNLPRGSQVIPNHNTERLLRPANGNGGGATVEINIINNSGAKVEQRERQTANGKAIDVMIDEAVAQKINTPGSHSRGAIQGQFGVKGALARR